MDDEAFNITEITYMDLENICRICMSKDKIKLLNTLHYDSILLSDMYRNYTNLELDETDNLPQNICVTCITMLIKVHTFIKKCKETSDILKELIQNREVEINKIKDEIVDDNNEEVEEYVYVHIDDEHNYDVRSGDEELLQTFDNGLTHSKEYEEEQYIRDNAKPIDRKQDKSKNDSSEVFVCNVCGKALGDRNLYEEHLETHSTELPFKCSHCDKRCETSTEYEQHLLEHNLESEDELEFPIKLVCEVCNIEFANEIELIQHEHVHGKKYYKCETCDKKYFTSLAFESHKKIHDGCKPFTCTRCDKSFTQFALLKRHFFVHTGHKPFSCDVCFRTFSQNAHLKTHFKTHTGERPYSCPYCNKAFALNGNLKVHVRTHTGEKPFLCDVCGKGFYHSSTMKKHRVTHVKRDVNAT